MFSPVMFSNSVHTPSIPNLLMSKETCRPRIKHISSIIVISWDFVACYALPCTERQDLNIYVLH